MQRYMHVTQIKTHLFTVLRKSVWTASTTSSGRYRLLTQNRICPAKGLFCMYQSTAITKVPQIFFSHAWCILLYPPPPPQHLIEWRSSLTRSFISFSQVPCFPSTTFHSRLAPPGPACTKLKHFWNKLLIVSDPNTKNSETYFVSRGKRNLPFTFFSLFPYPHQLPCYHHL